MTHINQLLQEFAKTRSQEDQNLLAALVGTYEATSGFFDTYPLAEIVKRFTSQIHAIAARLPEEGDNIGERKEMQDGLYFNVEVLQQILLMHERIEAVSKFEKEHVSELEIVNGALAYSKIMMQRSLQMADERSN